jgi:glycosyltransferase involved in cell wall biosynthesis
MITILIPSYNHANYVIGCIKAAAAVKLAGRKILIIDDGSTDGSVQIINDYLSGLNDGSIEFISKPNGGLVSSLNMGLARTDTEFFYLVASDDIPQESGIARCVAALIENSGVKFVIGGGYAFYENEPGKRLPVYGKNQEEFFSSSSTTMARNMFLNYPSPLLLQSTVFRSQALRDIGGWDAALVLDDYPTFVKLLFRFPVRNADFIYLPEACVVGYRQHDSNSYRNVSRQYVMVKALMEALAPASIKRKAISRTLANYMISALKMGNFKATYSMLKASELMQILGAVPEAVTIMGRRVLRKLG